MQTAGKAGFALFCIPQSHIGGRASKRQTLSAVYARRMCPFPASGRSGTVQKTTRSAYSVSFAGKAVHPFTSFSLGGRSIAQFAQKVKPHPFPAHKPADCNRGGIFRAKADRFESGHHTPTAARGRRILDMQAHKPRNTPSSGQGQANTRQKPVVQRPPQSPPRRKACSATDASRKGSCRRRAACMHAGPTACRSSLSSGLFLVPFPMALKRACTSAFRAKRDVPRKGTSLF